MRVRGHRWLLPLGLVVASSAVLGQDGLGPPPARHRGLVFHAPEGWSEAPPAEPERAAWTIGPASGPGSGAGPRARVTVTRLGATKRPVEQHVARWAGAFEGEDGRPLTPAAAKREPLEVAGVPATLVELAGAWVAAGEPGAEEHARRPGWASLHVLLDGPDGQWVIGLVGPADLVVRHREAVIAFAKATTVGFVEPDPEPAPLPQDEEPTPPEEESPPPRRPG